MSTTQKSPQREVVFVTRILTHYRVPFHDRVRALLAMGGVRYRVIAGQPTAAEAEKGDLGNLPWVETIENTTVLGVDKLIFQPILKQIRNSDLVVVGQESQLLINYPLQLFRKPARKIAFFGHGRNFQSRNPEGVAERWKRYWATRCDWWFAYTDETRRHIEALGFPRERITVFNNAVDTSTLKALAADLSDEEVLSFTSALGVKGGNVAIFVGGLYREKRLEFLVAAAEKVRANIPNFELIVVGGGEDMPRLRELTASRPWLFPVGPRFGREKVALMRAARLFLMPGLVGLAVLDAAAVGLPVVTTAWPWHSPEIAYLQDRKNGVIVPQWDSVDAYALAVVKLLRDDEMRLSLARRARSTADQYTISAMAERFACGIFAALE